MGFIDGSYVKAHQHSAGQLANHLKLSEKAELAGHPRYIWRSMLYGLPIAFNVTGGEVNDCTEALGIIESLPGYAVFIMDKGESGESET